MGNELDRVRKRYSKGGTGVKIGERDSDPKNPKRVKTRVGLEFKTFFIL